METEIVRLYPTQYWFVGQGGKGIITLVAPDELVWTVSTSDSWMSLSSSAHGRGSARLEYEVAPNPGSYRHGSVNVAGLELRIFQLPKPHWQEHQVLKAPLPYIEQVGLQGFLNEANKLPPPARLAAYTALIGAVNFALASGEALYTAAPQVPQEYTPQFIEQQQLLANELVILSMSEDEGGGR